MNYPAVKKRDKAVHATILGEGKRQEEGLEMIASENYVSEPILEALGTVFTNKYSEGYPGHRYYGGQEWTDAVETIAIERAKKLFGAEHVNVQPLSGASANMAAYAAILEPGDTVLGMDLSHGGHLTHGHPVTLSAKVYHFVRYKTEPDGTIDYKKLAALAKKEKPKLILAGFSSYTRQLDYAKFASIAKKVKAYSMMDMAHIAGLVAGKALPNPVPYFDIVTTTTHKTLRGPRGGMILCKQALAQAINKAVFPGLQGGPHMNIIAAKAVAFGEALQPEFKRYAKQTIKNAKTLEKEFTKRHYRVLFGGTENHMILVDVFASLGISGKEAEQTLDEVGITVNKNMIPDDTRSPFDPSGIRIGVPAITTRGMQEQEVRMLARIMDEALRNRSDKKLLKQLHGEVKKLCKKFPLYT
ncbi:MAG: serine hydroxymethyltransferase [Candidatus Moranbacteria bacterium RIFCSPHIGHO2_01_FULL_54_31]|nr:MAG: serine hydroxymethyltransferase [Candidatus Moranbacteria bacterium RIFCSPHIGHO2_01_FULL_54_31]